MELKLGGSRLGLDRDQLVAVRDGKGVRVSCLSGRAVDYTGAEYL